ncbi:flagellar protein FlhE [Siccibacter turicensis]|uniref:Flagellar protein FlhE n=1 Tax=Siccibacter turicensis TaxID=357233 RepID=A0A2P8VKL2_9ENTR|nr:flagellar protein FlhE [Siccibacter turicensis]PSN08095.1 flagellar protein FlhE [Siccibacter turicensis]
MRAWLLLLWLPFAALAAGEGAWEASTGGTTLTWRGVVASSSPLAPTDNPVGMMNLVVWRYELNGPTPAGLLVRLCSLSRCVPIEGGQGTTRGLTGVPANEPLRFVWEVPGGGKLFPMMRVQSSQVIVNYK